MIFISIAHPYYLGLYEQYVREHFGVELRTRHAASRAFFTVTQAMRAARRSPQTASSLGDTPS